MCTIANHYNSHQQQMVAVGLLLTHRGTAGLHDPRMLQTVSIDVARLRLSLCPSGQVTFRAVYGVTSVELTIYDTRGEHDAAKTTVVK